MGHLALATIGLYRHTRPASEQAARFTRAFGSSEPLFQGAVTTARGGGTRS